MKQDQGGLARRYARALFELAREAGTAGEIGAELRSAVAMIEGNAELKTVLHHRALRGEKKRSLVAAIWKEGLVARLLALLAERGRLERLPSVAEHFERAWNESRGVASGEAASATPLSEEQRTAIAAALGRSLGRAVELVPRLDPSLLGGVRVTIAGRSYDGSVRARLQALRERLAAGGA